MSVESGLFCRDKSDFRYFLERIARIVFAIEEVGGAALVSQLFAPLVRTP